MILPKYPVYVPSKGRHLNPMTAKFLRRDGVPFHLVVEPAEADNYREFKDNLLLLPWDNPPGTSDGLIKARNWIRDHATAAGAVRHWQLDDNIKEIRRLFRGKRIPCASGPAFRACEDFVDRYENVAIAGLNYQFFALPQSPPYWLNVHVYSCTLVLNSIPYRWRLNYNDDTDICLQALSGGWCTVLLNVFVAKKMLTMSVAGGNTDALYKGDGRLKMSRTLERAWPGSVTTRARFKRPQHVVKDAWKGFDTPLKRRTDVDFDHLPPIDEYGLSLQEVGTINTPELRQLFDARKQSEKSRSGD